MRYLIKLIALSLTLALALGCAASFASCSGEDRPTEQTSDGENVATEPAESGISLAKDGKTEYKIVRANAAGDIAMKAAYQLQNDFKTLLGVNINIANDRLKEGESVPDDACEILIGATNRKGSADAADALKGEGFLIRADGSRIVIVASDDVLLLYAVTVFSERYLTKEADGVCLPLDLTYLEHPQKDAASLGSDGSIRLDTSRFVITFDRQAEQAFAPKAANALGIRLRAAQHEPLIAEDKNLNKYEILFGECEREEFRVAGGEYGFRDFGLCYAEGKLSVYAPSIYGYEAAIEYLLECFDAGSISLESDNCIKRYDYGDSILSRILYNYENPNAEGAWTVNICHRGDITTNAYPENSLPSYKSCLDNGIDVIETDLRKTADGVWVILHDDTLDRTTDGSGKLSEKTLAELADVCLRTQNGGEGSRVTEYKIPTLEEIIELCYGQVIFNLDKLGTADAMEVYEVFEKHGAVDMAMFKAGFDSTSLMQWYGELLGAGRKLPLYAPMIYTDDAALESEAQKYEGLCSMIETGNDHGAQALSYLQSIGIRPMCLTALKPALENAQTWEDLTSRGYCAIMTDTPLELADFIHGS